MLSFSELLNKVWDLGLSLLVVVWAVRRNCLVRFDFCGSTVLSAFSGDQVSFYTTVGGVVFQFVKGNRVEMSHGIWRGA